MSVLTAVSLMVIVFSLYVVYIWVRFGQLSSISASSYRLVGNEKRLFSGWLILLAFLTYWLDMGVWSHVMGLGFVIAGMSLDHRKSARLEDEFHTVGTIIAIVAGFAGLYFCHGIWFPALSMAVGAIFFAVSNDNWILWTEIWAMITLTIGFLLT